MNKDMIPYKAKELSKLHDRLVKERRRRKVIRADQKIDVLKDVKSFFKEAVFVSTEAKYESLGHIGAMIDDAITEWSKLMVDELKR